MNCKHAKVIRITNNKQEYYCIAKQKEVTESDCRGCMLYNPDLPVMPKGIELGKSDKEINKMAYETMCEVLTMIDFKRAKEIYEHGKKAYEED